MLYMEQRSLVAKNSSRPRSSVLHSMLDAEQADCALLHDIDVVEQSVRNNIASDTLSVVKSLKYTNGPIELHGITAFGLLPGSHLTIHTYTHHSKRVAFCDGFGDAVLHSAFLANIQQTFLCQKTSSACIDRDQNIVISNTFTSRPKATYGPHFTTQFDIKSGYILDIGYFEYCLLSLIKTIGMTTLIGPFSSEDASFLSTIIIIAESHLTFHYDKQKKLLFVDIFSCREFSIQKTIRSLISLLPGVIMHKQCIKRGHGFYTCQQ